MTRGPTTEGFEFETFMVQRSDDVVIVTSESGVSKIPTPSIGLYIWKMCEFHPRPLPRDVFTSNNWGAGIKKVRDFFTNDLGIFGAIAKSRGESPRCGSTPSPVNVFLGVHGLASSVRRLTHDEVMTLEARFKGKRATLGYIASTWFPIEVSESEVHNAVRAMYNVNISEDRIRRYTLGEDVDPVIRNSTRFIGCKRTDEMVFIRQARRKALWNHGRSHTKREFLELARTKGMKVPRYLAEAPETVSEVRERYRLELSLWEGAGVAMSELQDEFSSIDPLVQLQALDVDLKQNHPQLWAAICERFHPVLHQFEALDTSPKNLTSLELSIRIKRHPVLAQALKHIRQCLEESPVSTTNPNQSRYLTHGDYTGNNVKKIRNKAWVFDWDVVRASPSRAFDVVFATIRLSSPNHLATDTEIRKKDIDAAQEYLATVQRKLRERNLKPFSRQELVLGFESVRYEYALRMLEYCEVANEASVDWYPRFDYVNRCCPTRVSNLAKALDLGTDS